MDSAVGGLIDIFGAIRVWVLITVLKHITLSPTVFFDIPAYFTSNLRVKELEPESLREIVENLLLIINL